MVAGKKVLTRDEILEVIGCNTASLPEECERIIRERSLPYRVPSTEERDAIILNLLKMINSDSLQEVGEHRRPVWQKGWSENLAEYKNSNFDPNALLPRYIRLGEPMRLRGEFIIPGIPDFEVVMTRILRCYLFGAYLAEVDRIYEFGCGTGLNLIELARMFPEKELVGLDWVDSSAELIGLLGRQVSERIRYRHFDFFNPDPFALGENSGVFTLSALEQLGEEFRPFIEFLLECRPAIVVHIEDIDDFYDEDALFDYLAAAYHQKRKYLSGFLPYLRELDVADRIEIVKVHRTGFGIERHDPFSYVAWRPR